VRSRRHRRRQETIVSEATPPEPHQQGAPATCGGPDDGVAEERSTGGGPEDDGPPDPILRLARRVIGTPIARQGAVLVPVAVVYGGSGGGSGTDLHGNLGQGAGWAGIARPVGAYVLEEGRVRYEPVIDVTRLALGAQLTGALALLVLGRWLRARS
jgi:hypothetical protein